MRHETRHGALVLARSGVEPETTARTTEGLLELASEMPEAGTLVKRYCTRISYLHGACFYDGVRGITRQMVIFHCETR